MSTKPYPVTPRVLEAMTVTKRGCEELLVEADWLQKAIVTGKQIGRAHV